MTRNTIEIERNIIENFLMNLKEIVKKNRKKVLYSFIGFLILLIVILGLFVYMDHVKMVNQNKLDHIMTNYWKNIREKKSDEIKTTINELNKFIDSTNFGFAHKMSYYAIGNIYYSEKNYKEAKKYLLIFADKTSKSSIFASLALLKAAIASEEMNDMEGAFNIYKKLEDNYIDSAISGQIYYNLGRLYAKKKDIVNSKRYFNKVITSFPETSIANDAKKRLFMLTEVN